MATSCSGSVPLAIAAAGVDGARPCSINAAAISPSARRAMKKTSVPGVRASAA
jgi:hypothetical protein